jgi:hypothetical protein
LRGNVELSVILARRNGYYDDIEAARSNLLKFEAVDVVNVPSFH